MPAQHPAQETGSWKTEGATAERGGEVERCPPALLPAAQLGQPPSSAPELRNLLTVPQSEGSCCSHMPARVILEQ